ncbi:MAG: efflux RND transporter periplasmic adaptor subunit [Acidobacteria bacterium]|nr:efflux RND transporter periplasmic adaptor subunit [Acidobacteriota bacterium]MBS1867119.1 efflux RND transporter periplasmic adaptor subunit [Acidobacteriota bacterium]
MKRTMKIGAGVAALILIGATGFLRGRGETVSAAASGVKVVNDGLIAAPGRVEAVSEEVRVSSELSGRLKTVNVEEGDRVVQGQVLAELENSDYRARVAGAEAELALREAELRKIVNGSRTEERREAEAAKQAGKAVLENAKSETERRRGLAERGVISRDEADRYERAYRVAQAEYEQASQRFALVDVEAREEDRSKAEASVAEARAQVAEARAVYEKSFLRAPMNGVILRKLRHTGESVSTQFDSPVITMADDSVLRVRLDVDETDVAKLRVGQQAYVTAEAFGDRKFEGKVIRVGRILGKKNLRTDEPTEHVDTKILETLVELNPGEKLPLGLRVDSYIAISKK